MSNNGPKCIALLTGGGDCPGLNAVIRGVTKTAMEQYHGMVLGIEDGFEGLVEGRMHELSNREVSGILAWGGTILGTSNKGDPWHYPVETADGQIEIQDVSHKVFRTLQRCGIDVLVAIGGDGTMHIVSRLMEQGVKAVGVPKTIDNDLSATDVTFGFDSAVAVVAEALDRLHTTASAHHRVIVLEVMGRYAGWIALAGGVAGGADIILLPEIPFTWEAVCRKIVSRARRGKRFSLVCVAEGARLPGGAEVVKAMDIKRTDARQLGGIGAEVAREIEARTGMETRVTVLGHLQRGGSPTAFDRILGTRLGVHAAHCAFQGPHGVMVAMRHGEVVTVPIPDAIARLRVVPSDHQLVHAARAIGTSFGDEVC